MRRGVAFCIAVLAACASSEENNGDIDAAETDAADVDATDAPVDAAIDAVDACVPVAETCNDADDDCDLRIDEDLGLGVMCDGMDADLCNEGMVVCAIGGGTMCSDMTADTVETCNAADDDCDLSTDEGFDLGMPCDGGDTDACVEGVIACNGAGGATCDDVTAGTAELCNQIDDDCRNGVDDGYNVGASCSTGVGACNRPGTMQCDAAGTGTECNAVAAQPTPEFCGDGIDQDCNGSEVTCPTNDLPSGAVNITNGGTFTVDLTAANDNNSNAGTCGSSGGRDVFYTFTLPAPEVVYFDTFGSNYDTVVRIFNGACTALGVSATCVDDSCASLQTQGAVQLAGGTYCLVVDQYSSFQTLGSTTLTFTRGGRTGTAISGSGSVSGTTVGATNTASPSCGSSSPVAPDVGYYFMACPATTLTVSANTCSTAASWDSIAYMRRAPVTSADLICNDDGLAPCGSASPIRLSSFTGGAAAGPGLFWLIVDGYNGVSGAYTLGYTIQ